MTLLSRTGIIAVVAMAFPVTAFASSAPTLTTYTISDTTIYPTASVGSGFATSTTIDIAFSEKVKASIKLQSSDGSTLTLYSSSGVTNPSPKTWDGTDGNGAAVANGTYTVFIAATSIATGLDMSDSSKTIIVSSSSTSSAPTPTVSGSATVYVPPPSALIVSAGADQSVMAEVPVSFSVKVTAKGGGEDSAAKVVWSFGDGSSAEGKAVEKTYRYPGTYLVVVTATDGSAKATDDLIVKVTRPMVGITSVAGEGITLKNDSDDRLDLSNWRIVSGIATFRIPLGMTLLPHASVMFPYTITNLPVSFDAVLEYPNGLVAARYAPQPVPGAVLATVQPQAPVASSPLVQAVEPISSRKAAVKPNEQAVIAPAAAMELAAAGAAIPEREEAVSQSSERSFFSSPWTYGFLGVVVLAAGAFILL